MPLTEQPPTGLYTRVIVDEALRRGISVEVLDARAGELRLTLGSHSVDTIQSLSALTSAVAFRRCDHKAATRAILQASGLRMAPGRIATFDQHDRAFLTEWGDIVVKPARGEQGRGVTVGVTDGDELDVAVSVARSMCAEVLLEQRIDGTEMRILVIDDEVVAAAVRRPPTVVGNGTDTVEDLIVALNVDRSATTDGASVVPLDAITSANLAAAGYSLGSVPRVGEPITVRRTANLHTGGTLVDVTDELHPGLAAVARRAATAIGIPVLGLDLIVQAVDRAEYVIIEANEQPGLANHEPRPTVERFVDLLFPETATGRPTGRASTR